MYIHMSRVDVKLGQWVDHTTRVGLSGITGNAEPKNPHVHVKMTINGKVVDPLKYLSFLESGAA